MALSRSTALVALLAVLPLVAALAIPGELAGREVVAIPSLRWPLLALVAIAALAGLRAWGGVAPSPVTDAERRGGWGGLVAVLTLASVLRLVGLEDYPRMLDEDEARNAIMADGLVKRGGWTPTDPGTGIETGFLYLIAACVRLFGFSIASVRLAGVICSLATVVGTFLLARELFGRRVAYVAALLCTVSTWTCFSARAPLHAHWVSALVGLTFTALARTMRTGRGWWVTGVLIGLSVHSFSSYRHGIALAVIAIALRASTTRGTSDAPVGLARGAKWLALGVAIPVLAAVPSALAGGYADWWLIVREQSVLTLVREGTSAWASAVARIELVGSHLAMVRIAERLDLGMFHGMAIAAVLPWLLRLRDPRFQLLLVMVVGLVLPPLAAKEDLLAWRRFMALAAPMFVLEGVCLVELVRRAAPRERVAIVVLVGGHLVLLLGSTVRDLVASGSRDEPRQAVMRSAWRYPGSEKILLPPGFTGGVKSLEFFMLDDRLGELVDGDPWGVEQAFGDALFVPVGTKLGEWLVTAESPLNGAVLPGASREHLESDRTGVQRLAVVRIPRSRIEMPADDVLFSGYVHIPRAGRWRVSTFDALRLGGRELSANTTVDMSLDRGAVSVAHLQRAESIRCPGFRRLSSGASLAPRCFPTFGWNVASTPWSPWRSGPVRDDPRSLSRTRERARIAVHAQAACIEDQTTWILAGRNVYAIDTGTLRVETVELADHGGNPIVLAPASMPDRPRVGAIACRPGQLVVVQTRRGSVSCHDRDGKFLRALELEGGWREPVDVATSPDGRVAVADRTRGLVAVYTPSLTLERTIPVDEPLAVCFAGGGLFAIDGARLSLVRLDGPPGEAQPTRFLGRVAPRARLAGSRAGVVTVLLPDSRILRLYDATDLALLAPRGDPAPYDDRLEPVAAAWDPDSGKMVLVEASGDVSVMRWR